MDTQITPGGILDHLMDTRQFRVDVRRLRTMLRSDNFVIAGGYLRDMVLGKKPKDFDVYYGGPLLPGIEDLQTLESKTLTTGDDQYEHNYICTIKKVSGHRLPIEIIQLTLPVVHVTGKGIADKFSLGLSKIAFDPKTGLYVAPEFLEDANNRTLTIRDRGWGEEGVISHAKRIADKYPDYVFKDPDNLMHPIDPSFNDDIPF